MNNKKDISELRKKLIGCDHVALLHAFASELIDMLASERQQSADRAPTQWAYDQACAALHTQRERAEKAESEIAALKGEQVPNAPVEIDATALIAEHRISIHFDEQKPNLNQPFVMRYVNCIAEGRDEGSCEPLGSDPKSALRRAISRSAIEAAGGKVAE